MDTVRYEERFNPPRFDDPLLNKALQSIDQEFTKIAKVLNTNVGTHNHDELYFLAYRASQQLNTLITLNILSSNARKDVCL